jgi:hypothetical protein
VRVNAKAEAATARIAANTPMLTAALECSISAAPATPPASIAATEANRRPGRGLPPPAGIESAASPVNVNAEADTVPTVPDVPPAAGPDRAVRWVAVAASLLVGVGLAAAFSPAASSWQLHHDHRGTIQGR